MSVHSYTIQDAQGRQKALSDYQGKVLLIVNTASQCGFTPQYAGLQQLYTDLRGRGFEILAFPCDQFGHQEPGTDAEIQQFCQANYGITFPVFAKIEVNGPNADPLYRYLTAQKPAPEGPEIRWNFTKFLVGRDGQVIERFASKVKPEELAADVEQALAG